MVTSFSIIFVALFLALVPFVSLPEGIDRAIIAIGGVSIILLEVARIYRRTRRKLRRRGELEKTEERKVKSGNRGSFRIPFLRPHKRTKRDDGSASRDSGREESDQFNVYQL